jgi:hypothetical protein
MLVIAKRLCLRHAGEWFNHCLSRLHSRLHRVWPGRTRLSAPIPLAAAVQVLWPHLDCARDAMRARKHARLHLERLHGTPCRRGNYSGRDARIDREAATPVTMLESDGAIDDHGSPENDDRPLRREEIGTETGRNQVARRQEDPVGRIVVVFVDDLVGRQRCPADIVIAATPVDPSRSPFVAWDPEPAEPAIVCPAAVMERHPTPVSLFLV